MAFDTTAVLTAIAEGRIDETEGRQVLSEAQEVEIKIAKLLTPKVEQAPVHEPTPEELAQTDVPQAETPAGEVVDQQPQPEGEQPTQ